MLGRTSSPAKEQSNFDERPSYQIIQKLENLLFNSKAATAKRNLFFKDGGEKARDSLARLSSAFKQCQEMIMMEETHRPQFAVSEKSIKRHEQAENALELTRRALREKEEEIEKKRNELSALESQLSNDIKIKNSDSMYEQGKDIQDTNREFNELSEKKKDLSEKEDRLNRKIEGRCCGCIPTKSSKMDVADLIKIQGDLRAVTDDIERLGKAKQANSAEVEITHKAEIEKLKSELETARKQHKELDEHFPDQIRMAQKQVTEAETRLGSEKEKIKRLKSQHYASLSEAAIRKMVNVYALFLDFQREAESYFIQPDKGDKDGFLKKLKITRDRFDESIALFWCKDLEKKTGLILYEERLSENQATPTMNLR